MSDLYEQTVKMFTKADVVERATAFHTGMQGDSAMVACTGGTAVLLIEGIDDLVRLRDSAQEALDHLGHDDCDDNDCDEDGLVLDGVPNMEHPYG